MSKINVIKRRSRKEDVEVKKVESKVSPAGLTDKTAKELEQAIASLDEPCEQQPIDYKGLVVALGRLDRATRRDIITAAKHFAKAEEMMSKISKEDILEEW